MSRESEYSIIIENAIKRTFTLLDDEYNKTRDFLKDKGKFIDAHCVYIVPDLKRFFRKQCKEKENLLERIENSREEIPIQKFEDIENAINGSNLSRLTNLYLVHFTYATFARCLKSEMAEAKRNAELAPSFD